MGCGGCRSARLSGQSSGQTVIEQYADKDNRADMPVVHSERAEWTGLAFRLGQQVLVAAMSEIEEIVDRPECASVPNTKPWFLGVGNVRGNLIPMSDLHHFVHGTQSSSRSEVHSWV